MITRTALFSALLAMASVSHAQNTFQRLLPADYSTGEDVATTPSGDVIVAGNWTTNGIGFTRAHVVKYTAAGTLIRSTQVFVPSTGSYTHTWVDAIAAMPTGGVVLAGRTFVNGMDSIYIACLDNAGGLLWSHQFDPNIPGVLGLYMNDIAVAPNGDVVLLGEISLDGGALHSDGFAARFSSDGTLLWNKRITPPVTGTFTSLKGIAFPAGGGITIVGRTWLSTEGSWLMHLADDGSLQWVERFTQSGTPVNLQPVGLVPTSTGYHAWFEDDFSTSDPLTRITTDLSGDATGAGLYTVAADKEFIATDVSALPGEGSLIAGAFTHTSPIYNSQTLMMKMDAAGALQWAHAYGTGGYEYGAAAAATSDGGYLLAGNGVLDSLTMAEGSEERGGVPVDMYIVKTNSDGYSLGCEEDVVMTESALTVTSASYTQTVTDLAGWSPIAMDTTAQYEEVAACVGLGVADHGDRNTLTLFPDPVIDRFTLACTAPLGSRARFIFLDIAGRDVSVLVRPSPDRTSFDASALPQGCYFAVVHDGLRPLTVPFIKQ